MFAIESDAVRVVLNPEGGLLDEVVFRAWGQELRPMHRAPWRAAHERLPADTPVVERNLAGDIFCAPFGANDLDDGPGHGPSANGEWRLAGTEAVHGEGKRTSFILEQPVLGARLSKQITLFRGQPIVYERHVFAGGQGRLPVGHHPMIHVPGGAALAFSPKAFGLTAATPTEPDPSRGRSVLAYPQRFASLTAVKRADGTTVDASHFPFAENNEEIVLLAEAPGAHYGWSAALAVKDGFVFFGIKDARVLPFTLLWMSNGGRDYSPWNSRHRHVLGVEEIRGYFHLGHRASTEPNELTEAGYPTAVALVPGGSVTITYAFGAIPAPTGWTRVTGIDVEARRLRLRGDVGTPVEVPFDRPTLDGGTV